MADRRRGGILGSSPYEVFRGRVVASGGVDGRGDRVKNLRLLMVRSGSYNGGYVAVVN
jgi:hypothetical protein